MTVCSNNIKKLLLVVCLSFVGMPISTLTSCFQNFSKYADINKYNDADASCHAVSNAGCIK